MRLIVETQDSQEVALIVQSGQSAITPLLEAELNSREVSIQEMSHLPKTLDDYQYVFMIKDAYTRSDFDLILSKPASCKLLFIAESEHLFNSLVKHLGRHTPSNVRIVQVDQENPQPDAVERALWFMLSESSELSLDLTRALKPLPQIPVKRKKPSVQLTLTKRRLILAGILFFVGLHTLFLVPLGIASFYTYRSGKALQNLQIADASKYVNKGKSAMNYTHATYALAEPGLRFLFLSVVPTNIIAIHDEALSFIQTSIDTSGISRTLASKVLDPVKTPEDIALVRELLGKLHTNVSSMQLSAQSLADRIDFDFAQAQEYKRLFQLTSDHLLTLSALTDNLPYFLADNAERNYIVYFYNNMEIRPGGGFLGSFAHVSFESFSLKNFTVYDVYDADGQLKTHVRPPKPIRDVLRQPHWFLRDSNFHPDFSENVKTAEFFLEKELGLTNFDGSVGVTTTALTYLLEGFGTVYIADLDKTISADNFYLEAQAESDIESFPGSQKKKNFLSTVAKSLMLSLEKASPRVLASAIRQALDEKHIVMQVNEPSIQKTIESLGWSGKVLSPQCVRESANCVVNHVLPVDANLGVNKANYFVSKLMKLRTVIEDSGTITNEFSVAFTNNSAGNVFPGGRYVNYFQLYLPSNADITQVDIDGLTITDYEVSRSGVFQIIGISLAIDPQSTQVVTVSYDLQEQFRPGENLYQFVLQKQIGSFNSDFTLEIVYPDSVLLTNQNFKSVAKNQSVLYNSNLSTNKVFVTEFVKQ